MHKKNATYGHVTTMTQSMLLMMPFPEVVGVPLISRLLDGKLRSAIVYVSYNSCMW